MEYTKDPKFIEKMFDEISPTYVKLNHIFSGMQDIKWRKQAVNVLKEKNAAYPIILDLASGTGDLAKAFLRLNPEKVYSADLSSEMLRINEKLISSPSNIVLQANAEHLPFPDNYFDLIGVGFGVRNFESLDKCAEEIYRVLKPGGQFLTIEMFRNLKIGLRQRSFKFYFKNILPRLGNFISKSKYAYDYLFQSVDSFLSVNEYKKLLESKKFKQEFLKNNFLGIVHTAIFSK